MFAGCSEALSQAASKQQASSAAVGAKRAKIAKRDDGMLQESIHPSSCIAQRQKLEQG
jgi:hypothetical protein